MTWFLRLSFKFIFGLSLFSCLLALGFWQLSRADYKKNMLTKFESRQSHTPLSLTNTEILFQQNPDAIKYRNVTFFGQPQMDKAILLDNQIVNHHIGFDLIVPFEVETAITPTLLLVNLGWLPGDPQRKSPPLLPELSQLMTVTATLNHFPKNPFLLGSNTEQKTDWPLIIQALKLNDIEDYIGQKIYPFLALAQPQPNLTTLPHWNLTEYITPARHYAYAIQWFGLAIAFVLTYWNILRKR